MPTAVQKLYTRRAITDMKERKPSYFGAQPFETGYYQLHVFAVLNIIIT
jgi:hypothetical protein